MLRLVDVILALAVLAAPLAAEAKRAPLAPTGPDRFSTSKITLLLIVADGRVLRGRSASPVLTRPGQS